MLNIEAKARTVILVIVSHPKSRRGDNPDGGANRSPMVTIVSGAPMSITGRRRPKRDRTLSDHDPINGSAAASRHRLMASARPTMLPESPRTAV